MTAYTITNINRAINGYSAEVNNSEAWYQFRSDLLREEVVQLPGVGWAAIVEQEEGDYDSEGPTWFIFSVQTPTGEPKRYFRKTGYSDSYDGLAYDGPLVEVKTVPVTKTQWEVIK